MVLQCSAEPETFAELGTKADGGMGYRVSVYSIHPDTEQGFLNLSEDGDGNGRRMGIAGNNFDQDHQRIAMEFYHDMLSKDRSMRGAVLLDAGFPHLRKNASGKTLGADAGRRQLQITIKNHKIYLIVKNFTDAEPRSII